MGMRVFSSLTLKGKDVILGERAGLVGAGSDVSQKSTPAGRPHPDVHMMEMSSQPRAPPSQGENPTSGEHLDQTTAMKAQHQTRVSQRPSPQALLQEKLQIFLLEAFKCHRTPEFGIAPYSPETDVPE